MKEELNYHEYDEVVKAFWKANIKQDYSNFDFIKAFESFESLIYNKIAEHGFLSLEVFEENQNEMYNYECLKELEQLTDYIQITQEDLKKVIIEYKYKINKEEFTTGNYSNLDNLKECYDEIQKVKEGLLNHKEMVFLFDKVIHIEHETGLIIEDYFKLDEHRKDFEKENKEVKTNKIKNLL